MNVSLIGCVVGFFLALLCPCAADEPRLAIALSADRAEYYVGELIEVVFTVHNEGDVDYRYFDRNGDRSGRMPEYELQVADLRGTPLCVSRAYYMGIGGGLCGERKLDPGKSFTKRILLQLWACPRTPGAYRVTGRYHAERRTEESMKLEYSTYTSKPMSLALRPMPSPVLKRVLNDHQVIAENDTWREQGKAILGLGVLGVQVVIPLLIKYLDGEQPFWAYKALLYVPDREAVRRAFDEYAKSREKTGDVLWFQSMLKIPFDQDCPANAVQH
ncbi:MAG: hypothetical protein AUJ92_12705 [Armatimonadetes bacterium CG2_30_59_28]|nr:hypothetical protein [Armatimonadota bacterium]OIO93262.1 MAG: hypothetical protein AUJ92_12705 [Armatimonadetes bacterium CG2_30_59_28]PIU61573.1 MAG: hypothetical protein COS85_20750 [Armatimonadetes bacterium CG07_land_8_20_14_0_80_59_28]PIX38002.1 MAG: hypothetical protein COZ56_21640 [Armatimonadetes bacterium CG_4_8_14_3_um_filter_58_9]PIY49347.1 MAG: hypothetical protein COZ05_00705 [Armatimonadetes bacterium CG_4_10_14_3_um_filter_59_10]